jgi:hypothetical protein
VCVCVCVCVCVVEGRHKELQICVCVCLSCVCVCVRVCGGRKAQGTTDETIVSLLQRSHMCMTTHVMTTFAALTSTRTMLC